MGDGTNSSEQTPPDRESENQDTGSLHQIGRPSIGIPKNILENFVALRVPISKMASTLGVSRPTIYNAMRKHNINYQGRFTSHDNEQVKTAISNITAGHPNAGEIMVQGHLRSQGICIQRRRLRQTLKEVDPVGTLARQRLRIKRRTYSVPCPNYLWHIDGNHKLIRWSLVLHHGNRWFQPSCCFWAFFQQQQSINCRTVVCRSRK